jgi:3-oxoacyl-[acyl-carrier-protein] synthase-3
MKSFIEAIATTLPEKVETNADLQNENPDWKMEMVAVRGGVNQRHIARPDETAFDLSLTACRKLFADDRHSVQDVDAIIYCTQTPDFIMPSNSHLLHGALKMRDEVMAFDINLACSGFVYALAMANSLIVSGQARKVLLVTAETYSKYIHPKDRSARALFGDGAAATLVAGSESVRGFASFELASHGKEYAKFYIPAGGMRNPRSEKTCIETTDRNGNVHSDEKIQMDGLGVWSFINTVVPKQVRAHLAKHGLTDGEIGQYIFHQASKMTLDSLLKVLEISPDRAHSNLLNVGNTVSASIPLCLADAIRNGKLEIGKRILLSGFGVGLSYATTSFIYEKEIHVY